MKLSVKITGAELIALAGLLLVAFVSWQIGVSHRAGGPAPATPGATGVMDRVVAHDFTLVDDAGRTRAHIGMNDKGSPELELLDDAGTRRGLLRLNGQGVPSLRLFDADGHVRSIVGFNLANKTEPTVALFDDNGVGHGVQLRDGDVFTTGHFMDEDRTWPTPYGGYSGQTLYGVDHGIIVPSVPDGGVNLRWVGGERHLDWRFPASP